MQIIFGVIIILIMVVFALVAAPNDGGDDYLS